MDNQGQQGGYNPTPPPSSSSASTVSVLPPPSPVVLSHPGYYSHHPYQQQGQQGQHGQGQQGQHYPTSSSSSVSPAPQPQQQHQPSYYSPYYSHHGPTQQQPQLPQQQQQHYQHHQQWTTHHTQQGTVGSGYYTQQQTLVVQQQQQQQPYPPSISPHAPYPPYVVPQQQQQHSPTILSPSLSSISSIQQQPQHALMTLSQFVSRQSPSPVPQQQQQYHQQQPPPHNPSLQQQGLSPHHNMPLLPHAHTLGGGHRGVGGPASPTGLLSPFQQPSEVGGPVVGPPLLLNQQISPISTISSSKEDSKEEGSGGGSSIRLPASSPPPPPPPPLPSSTASATLVQNQIERVEETSASTVSSRREGQESPTTLAPATTTTSSGSSAQHSSSNGHLLPVRLQNMQKGARTKASMRKLMQEQQSGQLTTTTTPTAIQPTHPPSSDEQGRSPGTEGGLSILPLSPTKTKPKSPTKSPKTRTSKPTAAKSAKKGKKVSIETVPAADLSSDPVLLSPPAPTTPSHSTSDRLPSQSSTESISAKEVEEEEEEEETSDLRPGYTKHGKKIGRPPKSKPPPKQDQEREGKKKGRKGPKKSFQTPTKVSNEEIVDDGGKSGKLPTSSSSTDPSPSKHSEQVVEEAENLKETKPKAKSTPKGGKKGRKRKGSSKKEEKEEVEVQQSESDYASSEGFTSPQMRPKRTRVSKKDNTTTPQEEVKTPPTTTSGSRSRPERGGRASLVTSQPPSSSVSPAKEKGGKEGRLSSKKSSSGPEEPSTKLQLSKKSPRLKKEPSPSPVRLRQVKDQSSPPANRRETRSSKDRDEIQVIVPTRSSRGRGGLKSSTSPSDGTTSTSPSPKRKSPKEMAEGEETSTALRPSTPRLAKGRSVKAVGKRETSSEIESSPTTITSKPSGKKGGRGSTKVVRPRSFKGRRSRKPKDSEEEVNKSAEGEESVDVKKRKSRTSSLPKPARDKVQKGTGDLKGKLVKEDLGTEEAAIPPPPDISEVETKPPPSSPNIINKKSKKGAVGLSPQESSSPVHQSPPRPLSISKPTEAGRVSIGGDGRRRSKSPRQVADPSLLSYSSVALQNTNPVVVIPPLPLFLNSKERRVSNSLESKAPEPQNTQSSSQLIGKGGPQVESAKFLAGGPVNTGGSGSGGEDSSVLTVVSSSAFSAPGGSSISSLSKPKKPRKLKLGTAEDGGGEKGRRKSEGSIERKLRKLEEHKEFQQRKATLEVEVAQVLLEMKNSSASPPVKVLQSPPLLPTSGSSPPFLAPAKPRKRRSTNSAKGTEPTDISNPLEVVGRMGDVGGGSSEISDEVDSTKSSKKKRKKDGGVIGSLQSSCPTILAVPQVNGSTPGVPYSTPSSTSSKKSAPPAGLTVSNASSINDEYKKTWVGKIGIVEGVDGTPKAKKKKTVVPKALTPIAVPETTGVRTKRKYTRKSDGTIGRKGISAGKQLEGAEAKGVLLPKLNITTVLESSSSAPLALEGNLTASTVGGKSPGQYPKNTNSSFEMVGTAEIKSDLPPHPKKAKKSSIPKVQKAERFQFSRKSMPVPTVFVKSPPLATTTLNPNGSTAGTIATTEGKERTRIGPSLKVIRGRTKFYRGTEEEDLDPEPPLSKQRGRMEFDPDVPWLCCFCNLGPQAQKLGDLFGPYYVESTTGAGKSKAGGVSKRETWMHGDCSLWAGSVVQIGTKLHGLEEALENSNSDSCTTCGKKGATIGCLKRGCKQAVHFPCAIRKSWKLEVETFHSYCPAHIT